MGYYSANAAKKYCEGCHYPTAQYYAPYGGIFKGPLSGLSFYCKRCARNEAIKSYMELGYNRVEATSKVDTMPMHTTSEIREIRRKELDEDNRREAEAIDAMLDNMPISDPDICPDCGGSLWDLGCRV